MNKSSSTDTNDTSQYLNTSVFFGQVNKNIISRQFKGGKVTNLFGETQLDFTNADISGRIVLEISQAFGEINLTVPSSWQVMTDVSQFLASTRDNSINRNSKKVLLLTGNSVFAVVRIKNS